MPKHTTMDILKSMTIALLATAPIASAGTPAGEPEPPVVAPDMGPVIAVPAEFDFGVHAAGATAQDRVWLINRSDEPMFVEEVRASCGCIVTPGFKPAEIAPNAAMPIDFTYKAPKDIGVSKTKQLRVAVRAQGVLTVPLTIGAVAEGDASPGNGREVADEGGAIAVPAVQAFGGVLANTTLERSFWVINTGKVARDVVGAKADCGCISIRDVEPITLASMQAVEVHYAVQAPVTPGKEKSTRIHVALSDDTVVIVPIEMHAVAAVATSAPVAVD